jgi:hypothetical protein
MIFLEEFVYNRYCGQSITYTSRSYAPEGFFMIDWHGSEGWSRFSEWPGRNRNHYRRVD